MRMNYGTIEDEENFFSFIYDSKYRKLLLTLDIELYPFSENLQKKESIVRNCNLISSFGVSC